MGRKYKSRCDALTMKLYTNSKARKKGRQNLKICPYNVKVYPMPMGP